MRIAVVEDKIEEQQKLCGFLEQYCAARSVAVEIACYASGEALLDAFQPGMFQCMFLDIYMGALDGMEVARQIYKLDPVCRLIFCTDSLSHAVASYEVRAAWYLTKPVTLTALTNAMDVACQTLLQASRALTVHIRGTEISIRLDDIFYMDSNDRKARIHLRTRTLEIDEPVGDILSRLEGDERFLTCNKNTVLNMDHVDLVEDHDFRLKNGVCVPIRQRGRAALKKEFLAWSLRELRKEERI